jgi:hypothetical protein
LERFYCKKYRHQIDKLLNLSIINSNLRDTG